jgi:hypothetical protein|nr:MAG TPA: hypothetical protein [Caudoviricetes sp.]
MSDSYAKIKLAANHNQLILVKDQYLTTGNSNSVFIEFALRTDDWLACDNIKAVFNNYYFRSLNEKLICDIPPEVLATPGQFEVGLYGVNDNIRISTNKIEFHVGEGTYGGVFAGSSGGSDDPDRLIIYDGGGVHGY